MFPKAETKAKRLQFALDHRHWTVEDWHCVIWTDECYIWLGGACGNVWVTCKPGEDYLEKYITSKFKKQNSVMIWGGILGGKKALLVLWDKKYWGTITAQTYVGHVLHPVLWPFWYWESHAQGQLLG